MHNKFSASAQHACGYALPPNYLPPVDYQKHYDSLMNRAKTRTLSGYSEKHHIVPRCMGGSNDKENLVRLTPEEHFVAHKLLVMIHPGNVKLLWAAVAMTNATKKQVRNNKSAGWLRREFSAKMVELNKTRVVTEETRARMRARTPGMLGKKVSDETKRKISEAHKGRPKSPEHVANSIKGRTGVKYRPRTTEHSRNASIAIKDSLKTADLSFRKSSEYRSNQSSKMKEIWAARRAAKHQLQLQLPIY